MFKIHTIELGKPLSGSDVIDDWIRLFNAEDEADLAMIKRKSLGLGEAIAALRELSLSRRLRYFFEMRQKARRDRWFRLAARSRTTAEFKSAEKLQ